MAVKYKMAAKFYIISSPFNKIVFLYTQLHGFVGRNGANVVVVVEKVGKREWPFVSENLQSQNAVMGGEQLFNEEYVLEINAKVDIYGFTKVEMQYLYCKLQADTLFYLGRYLK